MARTMTHVCNPSYFRGEDQEDCSLRPVWEKNMKLLVKVSSLKVWKLSEDFKKQGKLEGVFFFFFKFNHRASDEG
jgi:hypothetical protein